MRRFRRWLAIWIYGWSYRLERWSEGLDRLSARLDVIE